MAIPTIVNAKVMIKRRLSVANNQSVVHSSILKMTKIKPIAANKMTSKTEILRDLVSNGLRQFGSEDIKKERRKNNLKGSEKELRSKG